MLRLLYVVRDCRGSFNTSTICIFTRSRTFEKRSCLAADDGCRSSVSAVRVDAHKEKAGNEA